MSNLNANFKDPLVSIIIVNWNYGRFVGHAIASAKSQTYSNFECIVVDNASTDDSLAVITEAIVGDARFQIHQLPENYGHFGGALSVLERVRGEFIVFLDADDILFEKFLSSHIQVHLSTTSPSTFTSSNFLTIDKNSVVTSGRAGYIDDNCSRLQRSLPPGSLYRVGGISENDYRSLQDATFYAPAEIGHWCWAPGSANVIRRELVAILKPEFSRSIPFGGVDAFFLLPMFAMTGINMINVPLSAYRIHGSNDSARMPILRDLYVGNESAHRQNSALKRLLLLTLIDKCEQLATLTRLGYFRMLDLVERNSKDSLYMSRQRLFASDEVKHAIARKYSLLVRFFGERTVITELRSFMKVLDLVDVLWMAFDHRIPFSTLLRAAKIEMRRGRGRRHSMAHSGRAGLQSTSAADFRPNPEAGER
jgi:glycosyltransferase involved in cell wall biosynthesis